MVCTIVLAFGSETELLTCLNSLRLQVGVRQQIIVVQNGAKESLMRLVAGSFPEVEGVWNGVNVGAAGGRNIGIEWAMSLQPEYLFFADNDASFEPNALQELVRAAQMNPQAGFLGCAIYRKYERQQVFTAGAFLRAPVYDDHVCTFDSLALTFPVDFVGTGAMLVPASTVRLIGKFDEDLFVYDEDTDWCLRGKKEGLETLVVTAARAYHDVARGKFHPRHIYYQTRNRLKVAQRNHFFNSIFERPVLQWILSREFRMFVANDDVAITCAAAFGLAVWHYGRGRFGKCPAWMDQNRKDFFEARARRQLRETFVWRGARWLKHIFWAHQ